MEINVINQSGEQRWSRYRKDFMKIGEKVQETLSLSSDVCLSVIFVTAQAIHEINRDYRQIDRPTDVISFAIKDSEDSYEHQESEYEIGDIFINIEAIVSQARAYGHSLRREVCFLFTHGLLHLLGYDHMKEVDEQVMFRLQDVILNDIVPKKIHS